MSNPLNHPSHPVWAIIRLLIVMTALVIILYRNASHFDETELRTIIAMFLIATGTEGLTSFLSQFRKVIDTVRGKEDASDA